MACSRWYVALLGAYLTAASAHAQVLHVVSANCEIYSYAALPCLPPIEIHRFSPASFTTFADSGICFLSGCSPLNQALSAVQQITTLLPESAYIHQSVNADFFTGALAAKAHSDASIVFRVDAGRTYSYALDVYLSSVIGGRGIAIARFSLTRTGPGGAVIHSYRVQAGPREPMVSWMQPQPHGTLEAGDYSIEAHTSADGSPNGIPITELIMRFGLRDVTAVAPTTWGVMKSLYRE